LRGRPSASHGTAGGPELNIRSPERIRTDRVHRPEPHRGLRESVTVVSQSSEHLQRKPVSLSHNRSTGTVRLANGTDISRRDPCRNREAGSANSADRTWGFAATATGTGRRCSAAASTAGGPASCASATSVTSSEQRRSHSPTSMKRPATRSSARSPSTGHRLLQSFVRSARSSIVDCEGCTSERWLSRKACYVRPSSSHECS